MGQDDAEQSRHGGQEHQGGAAAPPHGPQPHAAPPGRHHPGHDGGAGRQGQAVGPDRGVHEQPHGEDGGQARRPQGQDHRPSDLGQDHLGEVDHPHQPHQGHHQQHGIGDRHHLGPAHGHNGDDLVPDHRVEAVLAVQAEHARIAIEHGGIAGVLDEPGLVVVVDRVGRLDGDAGWRGYRPWAAPPGRPWSWWPRARHQAQGPTRCAGPGAPRAGAATPSGWRPRPGRRRWCRRSRWGRASAPPGGGRAGLRPP